MIVECHHAFCDAKVEVTDAWMGVSLELIQGWTVINENFFCSDCSQQLIINLGKLYEKRE